MSENDSIPFNVEDQSDGSSLIDEGVAEPYIDLSAGDVENHISNKNNSKQTDKNQSQPKTNVPTNTRPQNMNNNKGQKGNSGEVLSYSDTYDYSTGSTVPTPKNKVKSKTVTPKESPKANQESISSYSYNAEYSDDNESEKKLHSLNKNESSSSSSYSAHINDDEEEEEEEAPDLEATSVRVDLFSKKLEDKDLLYENEISCRIFQYKSIADSILRSLNMFREASNKKYLQEDNRLMNVAMNHSHLMAAGKINFDSTGISDKIKDFPFVFFCCEVAHYSSFSNAFTSVVNEWTTSMRVSKQILTNFNVAGIGVSLSKVDEVYFTMVLALRTNIGYSFYSGTSLKSTLLADRCIKLVNSIRKNYFQLLPFKLDLTLCDYAFEFTKMKIEELTPEFLAEKLGICSNSKISFGCVPTKGVTPQKIVENWMNQVEKNKTCLGDFNRVGFGFRKEKKSIFSVCVYTRTLHAALIDGTETVLDGALIARQIAEGLNEFRQQHSLPPMSYDIDLCSVAQEHTEFIANGQEGLDPLSDVFYTTKVEPQYEASDISHMCCNEMSRAPKVLLAKWRNNVDCISVLLNQVDDIGVGVCFDKNFVCHITIIIASRGNQAQTNNIIVKL